MSFDFVGESVTSGWTRLFMIDRESTFTEYHPLVSPSLGLAF